MLFAVYLVILELDMCCWIYFYCFLERKTITLLIKALDQLLIFVNFAFNNTYGQNLKFYRYLCKLYAQLKHTSFSGDVINLAHQIYDISLIMSHI